MKIRHVFAVVPRTVADGHSVINCQNVTTCDTHEEAVEGAKHHLDKRSYNGMVIYQAVTLVQRTAPPIDIVPIDDQGELL